MCTASGRVVLLSTFVSNPAAFCDPRLTFAPRLRVRQALISFSQKVMKGTH